MADGEQLRGDAPRAGHGAAPTVPGQAAFEPVVFHPAGQGVAYVAARKGQQYVVFNGKAGKRYPAIGAVTISPDGRRLAYAALEDAKWFIVADNHPGPRFDEVGEPVFSPDSRFLVYRARKDGKQFVVVADIKARVLRQHPAYEMVFPVVFTDDGRSVAYGVKDGRNLIWKVEQLQ